MKKQGDLIPAKPEIARAKKIKRLARRPAPPRLHIRPPEAAERQF